MSLSHFPTLLEVLAQARRGCVMYDLAVQQRVIGHGARVAAPYTQHFESALALVPAQWLLSLCACPPSEASMHLPIWRALLMPIAALDAPAQPSPGIVGEGRTPALAICAAALRAHDRLARDTAAA